MIIRIPQKGIKEWKGIFPSKFEGDFHQTFNMDFERVPGAVSLSGMHQVIVESDSDATLFSIPQKFIRHEADGTLRYWAVTNSRLLRTTASDPSIGWSGDTITGSPTTGIQDGIVHGDSDLSDTDQSDRLLVTNLTTVMILNKVGGLHAWDTDWWTAVDSDGGLAQTALKSGDHSLARLQKLTVVGDQGALHTIDRNDVVNYKRIEFRDGYTERCIYTGPNRYWIGLGQTNRPDEGMIIEWDGTSVTYNKEYPFTGTPMTGFVAKGIPYFINQYGQIMRFTGTTFEEFAAFPNFKENQQFSTATGVPNRITKYACEVEGDIVKILAGKPLSSSLMRAGIWILDLKTKRLYHHQSLGSDSGGSLGKDFGQGQLFRVGGIKSVKALKDGIGNYDLIAGGGHYLSYTASTKVGIYRLNKNVESASVDARGYIVTRFVEARELEESFKKVWVIFRKFVDAGNKISVKYRSDNPLNVSGAIMSSTGIWVTDTHFTSIIPTGVQVGHEIEVLAGQNGGQMYHISALNDTNGVVATPNGATNLDVSISETAADTSTNSSLIMYDNWRITELFSDTTLGLDFHDFTLGAEDSDGNILVNSTSMQFKIELRGNAMEVEQLLILMKKHFDANE